MELKKIYKQPTKLVFISYFSFILLEYFIHIFIQTKYKQQQQQLKKKKNP